MMLTYTRCRILSEDRFIIIADNQSLAADAALHLARIGYENCHYYQAANLAATAADGEKIENISMLEVAEVKALTQQGWELLDVRKITEYQQGHIAGSKHIFLGDLSTQIDQLSTNKNYITMCASGMRATVAAGFLKAKGFDNLRIFMGSMGAWKSAGNPIKKQ